jgi:hypothetical protein
VPRVVAGLVSRDTGEPIPEVRVRAFHVGDGGAVRLGSDTTDPDGGYTISYTMPPGLAAIQLRDETLARGRGHSGTTRMPSIASAVFTDSGERTIAVR